MGLILLGTLTKVFVKVVPKVAIREGPYVPYDMPCGLQKIIMTEVNEHIQ